MATRRLIKNLVHKFGTWVFRNQELNFNNGRNPYGIKQTRLSPYTIKKKGNSKMLVETGKMRNSRLNAITTRKIKSSMDAPAGSHQDGGPNLPQRKIYPDTWPEHYVKKAVDLSEEMSFSWAEEVGNALSKK